jgi:subtilisin family serine protease
MDDNGHGTHVAGIVAALDNGDGVVGVAPQAELYALKVLDEEGYGYVSDVIYAIQWASDPDGDGSAKDRLDIINMSLGADVGNIFLKWACNLAYRDGLLIVAAAGNYGAVCYPAAYSSVVAVSATDEEDNLAYFSSTGSQVELAAPGDNIYSTYLNNGYKKLGGTSMASPHVAGTAALVWAMDDFLTNNDVRTQLQSTAEDIGLSTREQGYGLVDAEKAASQPTDTMPPAKVTGLTVTTVSCVQLDLTWDANTETDLDNYNVYRRTTSGGPYDPVASPTMNLYSDVGLTASTTYYYVVSAVDVSGNEGEASEEASGTTNAEELGPLTSDVVAEPNPTNGATSVTLTAYVSDATTGNSNIVRAEYFVDTDWGATESAVLDVTEAPSNIMYVESIIFSVEKVGKKLTLYTEVKILLEDGTSTVEGATVSMTLTYKRRSWDFTGSTDSEGIVKFALPNAKTGNYTATVTNVSHTDYNWDRTIKEETCTLTSDGV